MYIICCVPAQIPYFGKFCFLRYGPKCSQPIRLQDFLINHISRTNHWSSLIFCVLIQIHINQMLVKKWFFAWWCKFRKTKSYFNDFWVDLVKNGHDHVVHETLKSADKFIDWADFLHADFDAIIFYQTIAHFIFGF